MLIELRFQILFLGGSHNLLIFLILGLLLDIL